MNEKKATSRTIGVFNIFLGLLVIAFLIYGLVNINNLGDKVNEEIYDYGIPALFVVSVLLDLLPQFISPMIVLGSGILAGIDFRLAIIAVILGSAIGSILGFWIGKNYVPNVVDMVVSKKKADKFKNLMRKYGKVIVLIAAISPVPYLPIVLGSMKMSNRDFITYGLIPRALGLILLGFLMFIF